MLLRPPVHRGMKELDKSAFNLTLPVTALRVSTKSVGQIKVELADDVFKLPKLRNVIEDESSNDHRIVLLKPEISSTSLDEASDRLKALAKENGWQTLTHNVTVGYDHWSADEILKAILPDPSQAPTSYEQIGHIAHMNLRDEYLEYKDLIGQVILDKSPTVTMVVNKLDTIDNTFRNFKMEVLAGTPDFVAQVRENECVFRFDYSKVYWNSRLHSEHERLIKKFSKGRSICDVMAGVGPFAIPAAKRGALVWANDLNPASYEAMVDNIRLNKVQECIKAFNLDGRDFIRKAFAELITSTAKGPLHLPSLSKGSSNKSKSTADAAVSQESISVPSRSFDHVVMNLPAIAIEFLDAFRGLFRTITGNSENDSDDSLNMPIIHAHCFTKSDNPERDILQRACRALGYPQENYKDLDAELFYVRRVAPKKDMYCLSLCLPKSVAYAESAEKAEAVVQSKM
ncbi:tRNA(m(1)G37)methyltransferase [Coemansia spiralis]|uniref:tRNA (guanine(37)-N1)-methyltransferase n=2 Tax=Coemansia TaxID=4863 RepID=A0A9W8GBP0_9FUNG|nr:Met-10+ like-protein-domain-containing protein [Coemansia spiralis]KAJ1993384.1 tRNA(m(1)G37)methyltransferase [Coemansia umbellata]KAJ2623466.1 tRNA(m(1)G37)methyltransferase [Coemansia sp. RSA 1358]KAJ2678964.1 tRNA(m(1)G37)methyltransferase [Coemansia spiralis]